MGGNPGWRRTLDAGRRVSAFKGAVGGSESGTATIRGVRTTTEAREAAPKLFLRGDTRGDWRSQGLDLNQLLVLTVGSV